MTSSVIHRVILKIINNNKDPVHGHLLETKGEIGTNAIKMDGGTKGIQ
jgi:hypothetical protein